MSVLTNILIALVAFLHIYFLVLEMFLWQKPYGMKTFRMNKERAEMTAPLAANQGLYNGFLAGGLIWYFFAAPEFKNQIAIYFLACVIIAGIYGGYSVNKRIFFFQSVPALFAMICLFV